MTWNTQKVSIENILRQGTKYWFRAANASGSASWVNYELNFYEHTDKN